MPSPAPRAYGFFLVMPIVVGFAAGLVVGNAMGGVLIGLAIGLLLLAVLWLRDSRRGA